MSDNDKLDFPTGLPGDLTLDDLINEPEPTPSIWEKAHQVLTKYPHVLASTYCGGSKYHVSPPAEVSSGKSKSATFSVAVELNGKEKSDSPTLYIVKDGDVTGRIMLFQYANDNATMLQVATSKNVSMAGFDHVLDLVENAAAKADQERKETEQRRKANRFRGLKRAGRETKGFLGFIAPPLLFVGVVLGIPIGIPVAITVTDDTSYANHIETVVAPWDESNETYVVGGPDRNTIRIGEEVTLSTGEYYPDLEIPWAKTVDADGQHPRAFTIEAGSCNSDYDVTDVGYIHGDQVLVAVTDAPDGIIRVRVDEGGEADICAIDSGDQIGSGLSEYTVALQPQPAANFAASTGYAATGGASSTSGWSSPDSSSWASLDVGVGEGVQEVDDFTNNVATIFPPFTETDIAAMEKAAIDAGFNPELVKQQADYLRDNLEGGLSFDELFPPQPPSNP